MHCGLRGRRGPRRQRPARRQPQDAAVATDVTLLGLRPSRPRVNVRPDGRVPGMPSCSHSNARRALRRGPHPCQRFDSRHRRRPRSAPAPPTEAHPQRMASPSLVIAAGFCGALVAASASRRCGYSPRILDGRPSRQRSLPRSADSAELHGADAVDMESAAIGDVVRRERGVRVPRGAGRFGYG